MMRALIVATLGALAVAGTAHAQTSGPWMVAQETLESGETALVLSRAQPGGRAEVRILFDLRREVGVFSENCTSSSEYLADADAAIRLRDMRESFTALIGQGDCRLNKDVLDGFDAGVAKLEAMAKSTPLPAIQAWAPGVTGYDIRRIDPEFTISFEIADLTKARTGRGMVVANGKNCPDGPLYFNATMKAAGDIPARAEAARVAIAAKLDEAIGKCGAPAGTPARLMAGFTDAVARQEARLAKDLAK